MRAVEDMSRKKLIMWNIVDFGVEEGILMAEYVIPPTSKDIYSLDDPQAQSRYLIGFDI